MSGMTRGAVVWTLAAGLVVAQAGAARAQEEEPEQPQEPEAAVEVVRAPSIAMWTQPSGGYLGVTIEDLDAEAAGELGLDEPRGARVADVSEGSPASEAGFRDGDVILRFDGHRVRSTAQLTRLVRETPPGREVEVRVLRDGDRRALTVEVGERSAAVPGLSADRMERIRRQIERSMKLRGEAMERLEELGHRFDDEHFEHHFDEGDFDLEISDGEGDVALWFSDEDGRLGVQLQPLTDQLARHFGVDDGGALVASVREGSPAADAGLSAGDVIVAVGGEEVDGPGDVARAVHGAEAGALEITLVRDGGERTVTAELPEREDVGDVERGTDRDGDGSGAERSGDGPSVNGVLPGPGVW